MDTRSPITGHADIVEAKSVSPFVLGALMGALATLPFHGIIALLIWIS